MKGQVFFIGAGPGNPELITVKGKRLLEEADMVVYAGSLVDKRVLGYVRKGVEVYNSASMALEEIMDIIIKAVKDGKKVARIHSGDPTLYSAVREQTDILETEGITYDIIPGVSSAFASAAVLKDELTMPGVTQTVIFTRCGGRTPVPEAEKLSLLAGHGASMCIFLSVGMIGQVVEDLKMGYPEDTSAAVVYRVSLKDEKVIRGRLKDIAKKVKNANIKRQAVIIVGNTLDKKPEVTDERHGGTVPDLRTSLCYVVESGPSPCEKQRQRSRLYDRRFEHGFRKRKD